MSTAVITPAWAQGYRELWNSTPETREGTSDLTMVLRYRLAEDPDNRVVQFNIKDGECVYAGEPGSEKPDFVLTAKLDVWKQLAEGAIGAKKAITMQKLKFQGPLVVALSHLSALEAALKMVGSVDAVTWA
jgi:putative sterol carrier protein